MSDRPLSRRLVRMAFQALRPGRAHGQDLWPGLRIEGDRVLWRGTELLRLENWAAILPAGGALEIVGSGPSLKDQAVERLRAPLLLNGAATLADRVKPLAVMVEDERFIFRHADMVLDLPGEVPLLLSPAALRALCAAGADRLRGRRIALVEDIRRPRGGAKRALSDPALKDVLIRGDRAALSLEPARGVVIAGTVAYSAVQLALAAGAERILLAGIDLGNAAAPRFYERAGDTAPSGLEAGQERILAHFALARRVAEKRGVALACASPVSALLGLGIPYDPVLQCEP